MIISAKVTSTLGEILMTYSGRNLFDLFDIGSSLEDAINHKPFTLKQLSDLGMQLTSQLEIIHQLGFTHGDIKFQNICYDRHTGTYTLIDFALVCKIINSKGEHRPQRRVESFFGNTIFASEAMVNLMSTSRKHDLESLMYLLCFFYKGTLPVIDLLHTVMKYGKMDDFLKIYCRFRIENKDHCHQKVKSYLPGSMPTAFSYIQGMKHEEKPNYQLIKLWLAFNEKDEQNAFTTNLQTQNSKVPKLTKYFVMDGSSHQLIRRNEIKG